MRAGSGRSPRVRSAITLSDQALSSASNVLLLVLVAGTSPVDQFGIFAITYGVLAFALATSRAAIGVPVSTDRPGLAPAAARLVERRATAVALVLGAAVVLVAGPVLLAVDAVPVSSLLLALATPLVVVQDTWRITAIVDRRPERALLSDGVWLLVVLGLVVARLAGVAEDATGIVLWWMLGGVLALGALARADSSRLPTWAGLGAVVRERRRWELAADAAVLALTPVLVAAGVAALASIEVTAGVRGSGLLFSPVNVLLAGVQTAALAESAGMEPAAARRRLLRLSAALAVFVALYGTALLLLPDRAGSSLLGPSWSSAHPILPFTLLEYVGLSFWTGAVVVLRLRHRTRDALLLRIGFAAGGLLLGLGAALAIGTGPAVGAGLAVASLVTAATASVVVHRVHARPLRGMAQVE